MHYPGIPIFRFPVYLRPTPFRADTSFALDLSELLLYLF